MIKSNKNEIISLQKLIQKFYQIILKFTVDLLIPNFFTIFKNHSNL